MSLGGFVRVESPRMPATLMKAGYVVAIGVATIGWLWLIVWLASRLL
jgi:hypothetical protein